MTAKDCKCFQCEETFTKRARNQRFCSIFCRDKHKHEEYVKDWINRKPRKRDPGLGAKLEMARVFSYTGGWLSKFNAFRG